MFGTKRPPKVPEMFANDLSYGHAHRSVKGSIRLKTGILTGVGKSSDLCESMLAGGRAAIECPAILFDDGNKTSKV